MCSHQPARRRPDLRGQLESERFGSVSQGCWSRWLERSLTCLFVKETQAERVAHRATTSACRRTFAVSCVAVRGAREVFLGAWRWPVGDGLHVCMSLCLG